MDQIIKDAPGFTPEQQAAIDLLLQQALRQQEATFTAEREGMAAEFRRRTSEIAGQRQGVDDFVKDQIAMDTAAAARKEVLSRYFGNKASAVLATELKRKDAALYRSMRGEWDALNKR